MNKRGKKLNGKDDTGQPEKLNWKVEEVLSSGAVRAEITSALKRSGHKLYSIVLFREVGHGGRTKFFRTLDVKDIQQVVEEARLWVQADQGERQLEVNRA